MYSETLVPMFGYLIACHRVITTITLPVTDLERVTPVEQLQCSVFFHTLAVVAVVMVVVVVAAVQVEEQPEMFFRLTRPRCEYLNTVIRHRNVEQWAEQRREERDK